MFGLTILLSCGELFKRQFRHHRKGAILARPPRYAREARARGVWPFNKPRAPKQQPPFDTESEIHAQHPAEHAGNEPGLAADYGTFAHFDGIQAAAHVDIDFGDSLDVAHQLRFPSLGAGRAQTPSWAQGDEEHFANSAKASVNALVVVNPDQPIRNPKVTAPPAAAPRPTVRNWRNDYAYVRLITKTKDGAVDLLEELSSGKLVVAKRVPTWWNDQGEVHLPDEAFCLTKLLKPHRNIIRCDGYFYDKPTADADGSCNVLLEYCEGGDLYGLTKHWRTKGRLLPDIFILHFITSMADALAYMHHGLRFDRTGAFVEPRHEPVVHRDIKEENIFMRWTAGNKYDLPDIVLADFGYSVLEVESEGFAGTHGYHSPEVEDVLALEDEDPAAFRIALGEQIQTRPSDMYTFGVTLFNLMTLEEYETADLLFADVVESSLAACSEGIQELVTHILRSLLQYRPELRMTARTLFDLVPTLQAEMERLWHEGERMPQNPWPRTSPGEAAMPARPDRPRSSLYSAHPERQHSTDSSMSITYAPRAGRIAPSSGESTPVAQAFSPADKAGTSQTSVEDRARDVNETDMSQISGFTDSFCSCPNHTSLSNRRRGPNCIREDNGPAEHLPAYPLRRVGNRGIAVAGAAAQAQSYQAVLQSRFTIGSEEDFF